MTTRTIEELKAEADTLGVKYAKTIGPEKLAQKIEDFFESQAADDLPKVKDEVVEEITGPKTSVDSVLRKETPEQKFMRESVLRRLSRMRTSVVTITSNDKRENHVTTTAYLSCGTLSKIVPLDMPIELEEALIIIARTTPIVLHVDEIENGKRTGNKVPKTIKKYNVSYEDMKPV